MLNITKILIASASTIRSSTLAIFPSAIIIISSSTALLTIFAILITNDYIRNLKIGCTNLRDWINVITSLYEKTLKQSMIDKKLMLRIS